MISSGSYERLKYHQPQLQAALDQMTTHSRYDVLVTEFAHMAYYRTPRGIPSVLDEHNIDYDILRRASQTEAGMSRRIYNYMNYLKVRREEQAAWRRFDGCTLTSSRDESVVRRNCPSLPTTVIPNGVDTSFFRPGDSRPDPSTILFFGAIDYYPNTDGLLYFLREVLPQLRERHPALKLLVVGQSPPQAIRDWASDAVEVTGYVDDVRPYLERAAVVITPLRIGGGTRLKIVEAMAMEKAIVSTSIGAEGLEVRHERDILLADTPGTFADQVSRLLDDASLAARLGRAARQLAEAAYDWDAAVRKLEAFYLQLRDQPLTASPRIPVALSGTMAR